MDACSSVISPWGRSGPSGRGWQAVRAGLGLQGWGTAVRMLARRTIVGSGRMPMVGAHVRSRAGVGLREVVRGLGVSAVLCWECFCKFAVSSCLPQF